MLMREFCFDLYTSNVSRIFQYDQLVRGLLNMITVGIKT